MNNTWLNNNNSNIPFTPNDSVTRNNVKAVTLHDMPNLRRVEASDGSIEMSQSSNLENILASFRSEYQNQLVMDPYKVIENRVQSIVRV